MAVGLALGVGLAVRAETPRHILLLYPESFYRPSVVAFDVAFRTHVRAHTRMPVEFDMENIGAEDLGNQAVHEAMHVLVNARYGGRWPDVVVASAPDYFWRLTHCPQPLFSDIPKVFYGMLPGESPPPEYGSNTCSVVYDVTAAGSVELALRLQPETQRVVFLYGSGPHDIRYARVFLRGLERFRGRIEMIEMTGLSLEEFEAQVAALPPRTVVFYGTISKDRLNRQFNPITVLHQLYQRSNAPIYSMFTSYLGEGVVGGYVIRFKDIGEMAAGLALRLLDGVAPEQLAPCYASSKGRFMVDWSMLRRWNLPRERLPAGVVVINPPHNLWREHRVVVLEFLLTLAVLLAFVIVLLWQRHRLLATRTLLNQERGELHRSQAELQRLAGVLIDTDEADRSRLARELHDDISQRLAALALGLAQLERNLELAPARTREAIQAQQQALATLARDLHGLARRLHPAILDDLGLVRAMESMCQATSRQYGIPVHFYSSSMPEKLSPSATLCLYRIAQEALANAVKHAHAPDIRVYLTGEPGRIALVVEDEGDGFDAGGTQKGIGLASMRERVRLVGGEVTIFTEVGEGTTVCARIPFEGREKIEANPAAGG